MAMIVGQKCMQSDWFIAILQVIIEKKPLPIHYNLKLLHNDTLSILRILYNNINYN